MKYQMKFTTIKSYFLKDVNIQKVLVSKKIFSGEKIYKYFIGYLYDDYKVMTITYNASKSEAIRKKL